MRLDIISKSRTWLDNGNTQGVIDELESVDGEAGEAELLALRHWLLGKAYFLQAEERVKDIGDEGYLGFGMIDSHQVYFLTHARKHLLAAGTKTPEADYAAEAYYLAGRSMDHGYLQDFLQAIETYRWTALSYPDSRFGKKAAVRLKALEDKY